MPPRRAFRPATGAIIEFIFVDSNMGKARRANGASFCQVVRIRALIHEIDVITDGNQKWQGAAPSLRIRAIISSGSHQDDIVLMDHIDILARSIMADPRACAKKYLIHASVS